MIAEIVAIGGKGRTRHQAGAPAMKVLIYSDSFYPSVGGVETYVSLLAEALVRKSQEVTVVTQTPAGDVSDRRFPFRVARQPKLGVLWRMLGEADVVQLAGPAFLPLLAGLLRRKPIAIEHHGYQAICPNGLLLYERNKTVCPGHFKARRYHECLRCNAATVGWLDSLRMLLLTFPRRWMCQRAALNIPISHHVQKRLNLSRSLVIYYGIADPLAEGPPSVPFSMCLSPLCFAYVGRLVSEKGLPLFVEAAKRLKDRGYMFRLKFVGDGPERSQLEEMVTTLGLQSQVVFAGFLGGEALQLALEDVAAIVMPSVWEETAGLAAMEQMIRGRLVIAADIGGLGEVVGEAGLKFPAGDVEALTECVRCVLDHPELVGEIGKQARLRALQLFQQERMVNEQLNVYTALAQQRKKSK